MGAKVDWIARVRLASGVVLFVYVATHLLNHALGNISLATMEAGREVFLAVWRNPAGSIILYVSLLIHFGLVLYTLFRRRTLRMPLREALQIVAGLAIPPLLVVHVIGTRGLHQFFGINDLYAFVVWAIWVDNPVEGVKQSIALLIAWFHGCIGLHYWLKLKSWYPRVGVSCSRWRCCGPPSRFPVSPPPAARSQYWWNPRRGWQRYWTRSACPRRASAGRAPRSRMPIGGWRSFW